MLCAPIAGVVAPAMADGVLAVGITKDVAKDGFVYGYSVNKSTIIEARERAMKSCTTANIENTENAKKACKVVEEFSNMCVAFAFDYKIGTLGVGWAVASMKANAESLALERCKTASAIDRAEFCAVVHASCDGTAR